MRAPQHDGLHRNLDGDEWDDFDPRDLSGPQIRLLRTIAHAGGAYEPRKRESSAALALERRGLVDREGYPARWSMTPEGERTMARLG